MKVCVLSPSYEFSESPFRGLDEGTDPTQYLSDHECETHWINKAQSVRQIRKLSQRNFDVFINLCDGTWEEDRAGVEVVIELERLGQAFTGANSQFLDPTRKAVKLACPDVEVDTPRHLFAANLQDAELAAEHLKFPLFVKPPSGYGSIGITKNSRVHTQEALWTQVEQTLAEFNEALIEEYVDGREFTVLVTEPAVEGEPPHSYAPIEFVFPSGEEFKHFDVKWHSTSDQQYKPVDDAELAARLQYVGSRIFTALQGVGYARCDIRMDGEGRLFLLDVNPNPGVFYRPGRFSGADVILAGSAGGHRAFLEHIIRCAYRQRERRRKKWKIQQHPLLGYGIVATSALAAGEKIVCNEERPRKLASLTHVQRTFSSWRMNLFQRYAWPMAEDMFALWSDTPDDWSPINHSCDPNMLVDGIDFIARRSIAQGEALTLDYATLVGPFLIDFPCRCATAACRGTIRSGDYLEPWMADRYGDHVAPYVRAMLAKHRKSAG